LPKSHCGAKISFVFKLKLGLIVILFLLSSSVFAATFTINDVAITGNRAYSREKILQILNIKPGKKYSSEYVKARVKALSEQYEVDGYSLASIESSAIDLDSRLIIKINEGIISEMYIRGTGLKGIFLLRQEVTLLRGQTFNSIELKKSLNTIKKKHGYRDISIDIVPIPGRPGYYNLFIYISNYMVNKGLYWNVGTAGAYGVKTYIGWRQRDFFGRSSEYYVQASIAMWNDGVRLQEYEFAYLFPVSTVIRPFISALYGVYVDGRYDLDVVFKRQMPVISAGIQFRVKNYFNINLFYSCAFPIYFKIDLPSDKTEASFPELYNYDKRYDKFEIQFKFSDEPFVRRSDLVSFLLLQGLYIQHKKDNSIFKIRLTGKKVVLLGYNQLILEMRGMYVFGKAPLFHEEQISDQFLRGYAGGSLFTDRAIQLSVEYRFSLYKGQVFLCWFVQSTWFNQLRWSWFRVTNNNLISAGPGLYLQYKEFGGYIYYGVGYRERSDKGEFTFAVTKVF
jgi:hypothetical protein